MFFFKVLTCLICIVVKISLAMELSHNNYHPLSSHQKWLRDLQKNYRSVRLQKIGESFEGRDLLLLKICNHGRCGQRPVYWIDAGIHAREWIGPAVLTYFVKVKSVIIAVIIVLLIKLIRNF